MKITIKNEEQIDGIRKSCHLAADALEYIEDFMKPGISTEEIDAKVVSFLEKYGAQSACFGYKGYPKSICTSINEVICHGIPSEKDVLKEGDIINVDIATILNGYFGDTCKMYAIGKVSEEAQKLISVAKDCLDIGIVEVKPGAEFWKIGKAIQKYADLRGYSVVHQFGGHGTGLYFHEEPIICHNFNPKNLDNRKMEPGMIFTIEPMLCTKEANAKLLDDGWTAITEDGGLSAQWEHTLLVTEWGVEVLTKI